MTEKPNQPIKKAKKRKLSVKENTAEDPKLSKKENTKPENQQLPKKPKKKKAKKALSLNDEEILKKYPVLSDQALITKFSAVKVSNNQKGRIRQALRDSLKGISDASLPDILNNKIQMILKSSDDLTETDLRKIRILYNMLKTATTPKTDASEQTEGDIETADDKEEKVGEVKEEKKAKKQKKNKDKTNGDENIGEDGDAAKKDDKKDVKVKGPKRYVVFIGNLPIDVEKEQILKHFSDLSDQITDLRMPKVIEGKKAAIAYLELKDEPSYELALSKNHTMLANRRINVMYTTQQGSKISKTEAKGKAAKLAALQKTGQLLGSIPLNKKRSQRRKKQRIALAKEAKEKET
ncbi:unnamed protein product [Plutella xylostella]|uniref:(diamondback moth) hypothetical protein n=1 Tax=Plutella xylostella TaxID=51655 RepID=A0A8S4GAQ8_PLUXY|nr:unnamed protein product [Plutella xylostella]